MTAFDGARPFVLLSKGSEVEPAHACHEGFELAAERERGLDSREDHLAAGIFRATLQPGASVTFALSAEAAPLLDGEAAWQRRRQHEDALAIQPVMRWRSSWNSAP